MGEYFDRQGNPMTLMEWAKRYEKGQDAIRDEKRVAETTLANGRWVSTVWLGLNHQYGYGPPLIFETMVFKSKGELDDMDCERYSTEAEAIAGHARLVEKWTQESPPDEAAADPQVSSTGKPPTREKEFESSFEIRAPRAPEEP
jgi:hypothetical protein